MVTELGEAKIVFDKKDSDSSKIFAISHENPHCNEDEDHDVDGKKDGITCAHIKIGDTNSVRSTEGLPL